MVINITWKENIFIILSCLKHLKKNLIQDEEIGEDILVEENEELGEDLEDDTTTGNNDHQRHHYEKHCH